MQSTSFKLVILISIALLTSFTNEDVIIVQDEPMPFKPAGYYISEVNDDRSEKSAIAQLITISPTGKSIIQQANLQGGVSTAISKFIANNLDKDKSLTPITISVKEFKLIETILPDKRIDGNINVLLSFGLQKNYGIGHLVDYKSGLHYTRSARSKDVAEPQIRKLLKSGLIYFNEWMKVNTHTNYKLTKKVNISFKDYTEKPEGDTIYYAANRPLTWDDFQSKIASSGPFAAEVMPSIGYDVQSKIQDGTIYVIITMKTYLPKSACWVNYAGRNDYALNHEQRHFDVVKIITEQYKQKVLTAKLNPDTYEAFIGMQYLDSFRDMYTMQTAYDTETKHGRDHFAQANWNDKIDKLLEVNMLTEVSSLNN
jgi:hypothetical protein